MSDFNLYSNFLLLEELNSFEADIKSRTDCLKGDKLFEEWIVENDCGDFPLTTDSDIDLEDLNSPNISCNPVSSSKDEKHSIKITPIKNEFEEKKHQLSNIAPYMQSFPSSMIADFKHLIYNKLVEHYNVSQQLQSHSTPCYFEVEPCTFTEMDGRLRSGFQINNAEKTLPYLYALFFKKENLLELNLPQVLKEDLRRYYLRSGLELLSKYFQRRNGSIFLYNSVPLFIPGGSLLEAEQRIRSMKTRSRMGLSVRSKLIVKREKVVNPLSFRNNSCPTIEKAIKKRKLLSGSVSQTSNGKF